MAKMITVMTKARKQRGMVYPSVATDYAVALDNGTITVFKKGVQGRSFEVGDQAEYDSWNLSYVGHISKITANTVTIIAYKGHKGMEATHRLDMNTFCYRNFNFDAAETARQNAEEMMYL